MDNSTHKSKRLLEELRAAGIISGEYDKETAQLIVRKFFCDVFAEAIELAHCAHNKPNYDPPKFREL